VPPSGPTYADLERTGFPGARAVAAELLAAASERRPVGPLTHRFPAMTDETAYQIQLAGIEVQVAAGQRITGKKIALTSKVMQNQMGVGEPAFGHLLDGMLVPPFEPVPMDRLLRPKAEGEIAFLLGRDLRGPGVSVVDVLCATEAVLAAIEIADSRVGEGKIKLPDIIADNARSGMLVLGNRLTSPRDLDLTLVGMVFEKNGKIAGTGAGAAVLGHPAHAVAWLANKLAEFDLFLRAGEIVLSGAVTAASAATGGDLFTVHFDRLGSVSARFE